MAVPIGDRRYRPTVVGTDQGPEVAGRGVRVRGGLIVIWFLFVPVTVIVLASFNAPPSGMAAAALLAVASALALTGRAPRLAIGLLGAALLASVWADARPASGGVAGLTAVTVVAVGAMLLLKRRAEGPRQPKPAAWLAVLIVPIATATAGSIGGMPAKTALALPVIDRGAAEELAVASTFRTTVMDQECPIFRRAVALGPFGPFDCVFAAGSRDRPELVYRTFMGTTYVDHASGWEDSGLVYAPVAPPDPTVWRGFCVGHVVADWYQFIRGDRWGTVAGQTTGRCPDGYGLARA